MAIKPATSPTPDSEWTPLSRKVLARLASARGTLMLRTNWYLDKGTLVRVLRMSGDAWLVQVRGSHGQLKHAFVKADALSPEHRRASAAAKRAVLTDMRAQGFARDQSNPDAGRLGYLAPELSEWLTRALKHVGEYALADQVADFAIRACWPGRANNYTLSSLPRRSRAAIWGHPDRKPLHLLKPPEVKRRRWQIGVVSVRGELLEIGVGSPSVLRPLFQRLEKELAEIERRQRRV